MRTQSLKFASTSSSPGLTIFRAFIFSIHAACGGVDITKLWVLGRPEGGVIMKGVVNLSHPLSTVIYGTHSGRCPNKAVANNNTESERNGRPEQIKNKEAASPLNMGGGVNPGPSLFSLPVREQAEDRNGEKCTGHS